MEEVETGGFEKEVENNFDDLIGYDANHILIGGCKYKDLLKSSEIRLWSNVTEEELENFKYLNQINKEYGFSISENNIEDIEKINKRLEELGRTDKIFIRLRNKNNLTKMLLENPSYIKNNIYIQIGSETRISLSEYLNTERRLYNMVEPAKNLSPFEKYIYAYNIVKNYKEYRENDDNKMEARDLYQLLDNEYMVCAGYSKMLEDLAGKLGINTYRYSVGVDISYDTKPVEETISTEKVEHARRIVYINDPKYEIDGYYVSDPTWDNALDHDYYNYLLLTFEEETETKRYNFISMYNELLNINSIEEFYEKINFLLTREGKLIKPDIKNIKDNLISIIKTLDPNFIANLPQNNIKEVINDIGEYLLTKVNKPVLGKTIFKGVEEVYKNCYNFEEEELTKKLEQTILENQKRQQMSFPQRYKEYEDGTKEKLPNIANKFDLMPSNYDEYFEETTEKKGR